MKSVLENLSKNFKDKVVLKNTCYQFESGFIYVLLGRNGIGKTTLFHCIDSFHDDMSGEIYLEKDNEKKYSICRRKKIILCSFNENEK